MYKLPKKQKTTMVIKTPTIEGEPISRKVARITQNKEPIKDNSPIAYSERKDGVLPGTDIRTDRFELAVEAMDKKHSYNVSKREERLKAKAEKGSEKGGEKEGKNQTKTESKTGDATAGGGENPTA